MTTHLAAELTETRDELTLLLDRAQRPGHDQSTALAEVSPDGPLQRHRYCAAPDIGPVEQMLRKVAETVSHQRERTPDGRWS